MEGIAEQRVLLMFLYWVATLGVQSQTWKLMSIAGDNTGTFLQFPKHASAMKKLSKSR